MKVKELMEVLKLANPEADIVSQDLHTGEYFTFVKAGIDYFILSYNNGLQLESDCCMGEEIDEKFRSPVIYLNESNDIFDPFNKKC